MAITDWKAAFIKYAEGIVYRESYMLLYREDWTDEEWEELVEISKQIGAAGP